MSIVESFWESLWSQASAMAVLIFIAYLLRDVIRQFITERITLASNTELQSRQHEFEERIDGVRRDFERIQSTQERFLTAFLEISSERAKAVSKREIEAAEAIWASVDTLNRLLLSATTADMLKFDAIEKLGASDRAKLGQLAGIFTKELTPEFMEKVKCQSARLYVNDTAWAFYHAYSMIILSGSVRMMVLEMGLSPASLFDETALKKAILDALPHQKTTFDKFPNMMNSLFLDELRAALLKELKRSIHGEQSTEKEVARARAILNALPDHVRMPDKEHASAA